MKFDYAASPGTDPAPGEVVWTPVPLEEDASQSEERPVLLLALDGEQLIGLMLTSRDHVVDYDDDRSSEQYWHDLGAGPWDPDGEFTRVRLNRLLRVQPARVRREDVVLDQETYDRIVEAARRHLGV